MKYNLLDAFFRKRTEALIIEGKPLEIRRSKGGQDIYLDSFGRFILGRWQPKKEPKSTPFQRARERWYPDEKRYSIYGKGLLSAWRGRQLAMFEAWNRRLPMYEDILRIITEEVGEKIQERKMEKFLPELKIKLWRTGFLLMESPKPEVGEAQTKILFLYRDIKEGLNIGALLARTTAISARLRERLQAIYGWVAVYSSQSRFLDFLQSQADQVFLRVEKSLKIMRRHPIFAEDAVSNQQISSLANKIKIICDDLENLRPFLPYRPWVQMVALDFEQMSELLKQKNYFSLHLPLERILVSFEIKRQQRQIDTFLLKLGKDQILGKWQENHYRRWLEYFITAFSALEGAESKIVFLEPVCAVVNAFLSQAKDLLPMKNFAKLNRAVSQAYVLL